MKVDIVVVGTSLGGLVALETLLEGLPADFPAPIAVVQHRGTQSGSGLQRILQRHAALRVREAQDKDPVRPGRVYLAPPDYHLLIEREEFALSTEGVVCHARPSIDVLFESAADAYGRGVIGVIMTGANHDGARGALRVRQRGGVLIVQDPATAECALMPQAALTAGAADYVLPLPDIAPCLVRLCRDES